ncbi:MaoC/PaaZ C-terminal domain-containing protein [Saccharopolyspora sp. NPDC000995]
MNTTNLPELPHLVDYDLGTRTVEYSEADAILYAIAVGARATDLDLVYERRLRVLPTYGLALGLWAVEAAGSLGAYDRLRSLHAAQRLEVHAPLPSSCTLELHGRVAAVWDKKKAAIVDIEVSCPQFTAVYSILIPGAGGWGGERGPATEHRHETRTSWRGEYSTSHELAVLYRLTGDRHPVHIDPEVAAEYGFARPILHGLCTLGIVARMLAEAAEAHPCDLTMIEARFASPFLPGSTLRLAAEPNEDPIGFEALAGEARVISHGRAAFGGSAD